MKTKLILSICILIYGFSLFAQVNASQQEKKLIIQTALDYGETYYTGEVKRLEDALAPDLNKAIPIYLKESKQTALVYTTFSQLVEETRLKSKSPEKVQEKFNIQVLNVSGDLANVKLLSNNFRDYLQMVKLNNHWKIINALWTVGIKSKERIASFNLNEAKEGIIKGATDYAKGVLFSDPNYLKRAISLEFNKVTCKKLKGSNRIELRRQRTSLLIANSFVEFGKRDTTKSNYQINVLDVMDGLAVVEIVFPFRTEYIQFFKNNDKWVAFNCLTE